MVQQPRVTLNQSVERERYTHPPLEMCNEHNPFGLRMYSARSGAPVGIYGGTPDLTVIRPKHGCVYIEGYNIFRSFVGSDYCLFHTCPSVTL